MASDNSGSGDTDSIEVDRRQVRHDHEWELFSLLDQVPVGIFVVTSEGKPYYANRQARRLLGFAEVPDHVARWTEVYRAFEIGTDRPYPPERLPLVRALTGEPCEISDIEIRRDDKPPVPLHVSAAPVRIGGERPFVVAALQDVRELRRIASRDAVTALPNRAAAIEEFARERLVAERTRQPLAIALIDFDRFKTINDTYGHATGDDVLRIGAAAIANALRATDIVARWGGEELLVLLPRTSLDAAMTAVDGVLVAVRGLELSTRTGAALRVTCSAGVAELAAHESLDDVLVRADAALYAAKHAGRDRAVAATV
jgi:diguanylate cyclase (GGDEF)-like protein